MTTSIKTNSNINKIKRSLCISAVVLASTLAFSATPTLASYVQATGSVNIRTGPGTGYRVADVLHRGENVSVHKCKGGWCKISHQGPDGWVSARYLSKSPRISVQINAQSNTSHHHHNHNQSHNPSIVILPVPFVSFGFSFGH